VGAPEKNESTRGTRPQDPRHSVLGKDDVVASGGSNLVTRDEVLASYRLAYDQAEAQDYLNATLPDDGPQRRASCMRASRLPSLSWKNAIHKSWSGILATTWGSATNLTPFVERTV
jgi:hypothetical protein